MVIVDATPDLGAVISGGFDFGGLSSRIAHALETVRGKRLFLDPVDALFQSFSATIEVRRAFVALVSELRALGATTLIAAERPSPDYVARYGIEEFAVDNVVILRNELEQEHRRRTVEILKLRGCDHHKGEFPFVINPDVGFEIVPFSSIEAAGVAATERMSLGTPELDQMCAGGIYRDSVVMVSGATGTGKTLMGAHFLAAGLAAEERGLLLSFEESPSQLTRDARSWGIDLETAQREDRLRIVSRYPERSGFEDLLVDITRDVDQFHPPRLVIDSLTALERHAPPRAFREFVVGLTGLLKRRGVGVMMTATLPSLLGGEQATSVYLSTITDAIISLRYFEVESRVRRVIVVLKQRGSAHDSTMREYEITDHGMRLLDPIEGVRGMLGAATQLADTGHAEDQHAEGEQR